MSTGFLKRTLTRDSVSVTPLAGFTGSVTLKPEEKPTPRNLKHDAPEIECFFGDVLELVYIDETSGSADSRPYSARRKGRPPSSKCSHAFSPSRMTGSSASPPPTAA